MATGVVSRSSREGFPSLHSWGRGGLGGQQMATVQQCIPQSTLDRCEYGFGDLSMPMYPTQDGFCAPASEQGAAKKKKLRIKSSTI
jgi:hypothetical protein